MRTSVSTGALRNARTNQRRPDAIAAPGSTMPQLRINRLAHNFGDDRVCNEALGVSLMMHRVDFGLARDAITHERHFWPKRYAGHRELACGVPRHHSHRFVTITINANLLLRGNG